MKCGRETVTTGSPHRSGTEQRMFGGWKDLDYSAPRVQWLHTPLRRKPKRRDQDQASPRRRGHAQSGTAEEQLPELDDFCQVRARRWTPSCVHYMSWALSKARGCRQEHRGCA